MPSWVITASIFIDADDEDERDKAVLELERTHQFSENANVDVRLHTNEKEWELVSDTNEEET